MTGMTRETQTSILRACARFLSRRLDPIDARVKALEVLGPARDGADGAPGPQGPQGLPGERGVDGRSVTPDELRPMVDAELVRRAQDHAAFAQALVGLLNEAA